MTSVSIPFSVISIGKGAFNFCSSLTTITVESGNTHYKSLNGVLFSADGKTLVVCPARKTGKYIIPEGVTSIGVCAFSYCSSLTDVSIPEGVTSIGQLAFSGCTGLTSIGIPSSVTNIEWNVISECSNLKTIIVESGNTHYKSLDGVLFSEDGKKLIRCPSGKAGKYIIPDGVTIIEGCAFSYCSSLTSLTIPESVTNIGYYAFHGCTALTHVYYAGSVEDRQAIQIESENTWLTNDPTWHYNTPADYHDLAALTLPAFLTTIESEAFSGTAAQVIIIPASVTAVAPDAFNGCPQLKFIVNRSEVSITPPEGITLIE